MPRVIRIDDEVWTKTFRYDCDKLQFRFYAEYAAERARREGRDAQDYVNNSLIMAGEAIIPAWTPRCAFAYSAALSASSRRLKQSSVTTVMEAVEFFAYVLQTVSNNLTNRISEQEQENQRKAFLEEALDPIGRLTYYYATAFVTPSLLKAESWFEAKKLHGKEIRSLATDHFYLIRCHAADLIAKSFIDTCSLAKLIQHTFVCYKPESDRLIPAKERGNLRKIIARRINKISENELAYEAAAFTVDNCACDTLKILYPPGFHPSRTLFGPKLGCHRYPKIPIWD